MLARTPTGRSLGWNTDSIHILRRPSSRPQRTLQVPLCTSAARELLVTLRLRLRAIAASNGCPASRLRYYTLNWEAFFVVLVAAVYGVMSLQKISGKIVSVSFGTEIMTKQEEEGAHAGWDLPSSKAHMTCKALEWLDIGVCLALNR